MLAVAVGFELQMHPTPPDGLLNTLTAVFTLPESVAAMTWYSDWVQTAPFELQSSFAFVTTPMGPVATIGVTNFDPDNSTAVLVAMEVRVWAADLQCVIHGYTPTANMIALSAGMCCMNILVAMA